MNTERIQNFAYQFIDLVSSKISINACLNKKEKRQKVQKCIPQKESKPERHEIRTPFHSLPIILLLVTLEH